MHIFNEPICQIPNDLFIPPNALHVVLREFKGPLDLLLYLIRKQNIDVRNIPMLKITEQYLFYIQEANAQNLDLSADYLLMAALLIEIKSRMLLPAPEPDENDDAADPRADLVERLLIYENMKQKAEALDALVRAGRDFAWLKLALDIKQDAPPPKVNTRDLARAMKKIIERQQQFKQHEVVMESLSITQQITHILAKLDQVKRCQFHELLTPNDTPLFAVTTLLAALELGKEGKVHLAQNSYLAPIELSHANVD